MADQIPRDTAPDGYLEILAKKYHCDYQNSAVPGSCNRKIIRNTLRHAINLGPDCLVILSLTFLVRTEKFSEKNQKNLWKFGYEDYKDSIKPNNDSIEPENRLWVDTFMKQFDERAEITDLAADILMLTSFLQSRSIRYLIFAHRPLLHWQSSIDELKDTLFFYEIAKDPFVWNLLEDSLCDRIGSGDYWKNLPTHHLNSVGHLQASIVIEKFLSNLLGAQE